MKINIIKSNDFDHMLIHNKFIVLHNYSIQKNIT